MPECIGRARGLVWCAAAVLGACATPAPQLIQAIEFGPTEVPPQGFHQRCQTLLATARLDFEFTADAPLTMVVEYRERDMALQPLRLDGRRFEAGRFLPEATREYCLRWENPGPERAFLRYRLAPK